MPSLSFKPRFEHKVKRGVKTWTIRNFRKIPIKVGDRLFLYRSLRTIYTKKLGEGICQWTSTITVDRNRVVVDLYPQLDGSFKKRVFSTKYWTSDIEWFARRDGFKSWDDMKAFWIAEHGPNCFPFTGTLICWMKVRSRPKKKKVSQRQAVARAFVKALPQLAMPVQIEPN